MCNDHRKRVNDCCFACCEEETFVQDKICINANLTVATAGGSVRQTIYHSNLNPATLFASGTVQLEAAPTGGKLAVNFLLSGQLIEADNLFPGSSLAFTKTGFDTIEVHAFTIGTAGKFAVELCITPRYPID